MSEPTEFCTSSKLKVNSSSPKATNPKRQYVSSQQEITVIDQPKDIVPIDPDVKYNDLIAKYIEESTGVGQQTISRTIAEYMDTKRVTLSNGKPARKTIFTEMEDLNRKLLRQIIHQFWLHRKLPSMEKILSEVNADPSLPNFKRTPLYCIIKNLDFVYVKRKGINVWTEREELIVWRRNYLRDIHKYRQEGRSIYYLDEMLLDAGDFENKTVRSKRSAYNKVFSNGPTDPIDGKSRQIIVLLIVSEKGFSTGGLLYFPSGNNEFTGDIFVEWFESALPRLEPNSVVVMDNAPHHSVQIDKCPTAKSKKREIVEWLLAKGVTVDKSMVKPELMTKVRELKPREKSYVVDNLAKNAGHTVLRIPPHHYEFNPIELTWAKIKEYVIREHKRSTCGDITIHLNTAIVRATAANWENIIKRVTDEEKKIWEVDNIMDELIDQMEPGETSDDFSD